MGAFIDLKKELDAIKHRILIPKFQTYGLRDAVSHDSSFRKRYSTTVCGVVKKIQCDVPQSLVLGPEAFILCNSDICEI